MIIDENIKELLLRENRFTLGFSTGKDSLACAVILKNLNVDYTPFFFYHIPDLDFVNESIDLHEKFLGKKIVQLPHPMLYDYLRHHDFQTLERAEAIEEVGFSKASFEDLIDVYNWSKDDNEIHFDVVGMRAAESFNRRMVFKKNGAISETQKKVYPIYNWSAKDVDQYLKENSAPVTKDYAIWNRSFDGLKYQFLFGVKKNYPKDWIKILEYFPLIELELFRYEKNVQYFN